MFDSFIETVEKNISRAIIVEPLVFYKPVKGLLSLAIRELNLNKNILDKVLSKLDKMVE